MASTVIEPFSFRLDRRRLLLAILLLPLFDALLGYTTLPWLLRADRWGADSSNEASAMFGALAGVLGLLVMVTAAAPIAYRLERRGQLSLTHFTVAGALVGNAPFAAYLCMIAAATVVQLIAGTLGRHLSAAGDLLDGAARALLMGSYLGAASGAMFWLIAIRPSHSDGVAS
jgi:hypothetical protein